jgi:hypothetical protein
MPSAPPPPAQVDPGQSSLDFIRGMANPELQNELLRQSSVIAQSITNLSLLTLTRCFVVAGRAKIMYQVFLGSSNMLRENCKRAEQS